MRSPVNINLSKFILFAVLPVLFISCTSANKTANHDLSIEELLRVSIINESRIKNFDVFGDISFESDDEYNNGTITLCVFKPDTLYAKIQGPFGITGAVIFMNGENFTYYNVIESMVITGTASPSNLGAVMRFRTTREFLLDALSGAFDYSELKNNYTSYNILDTVYVIRKQNEEGTLEYHFKPEKNLIHLFRQYDNSGEKIVEISYDKYKRIDDCYFPSVIDMRNLKTNQRILLELSDIKLNIQEFSYNLVYPKNVKIIKWD